MQLKIYFLIYQPKHVVGTQKNHLNEMVLLSTQNITYVVGTGLHSAVGNVSCNRSESDCRSRGREFDPSPVPYFRGD